MGYMAAMVENMQAVCPWITRNIVNNELRRRKRLGTDLIERNNADLAITSVTDVAVVLNKYSKGGRPKGITN